MARTSKLRAATYGRGLWETDLFTPCVANFSATASASPASICPGGSTTLNVTVSTNTPTAYCTSNATSAADTDIGNVTFAGINFGTATPATGNAAATGTYTNNTATTAAQITQGSSYPVIISQITSGATWYGAYCKVFIDYNFDGDFDDAGETVFSAGPTSAAAPTLSGTVVVPANTNRGTTRMRVVLRESGTATTTVPCGTFSYGETEDYQVNISGSSNGSYTYSWSPATGLSSATVQSPTATPGSTTAYTCRISSNAFCSVTTSAATVTVTGSSALPLADVTFTTFTGSDLATVHPGWKEATGAAPAGTTSSWAQCNATQETAFGTRTARINLYTTSRREWIISPLFTPAAGTVLDYNVAVTDWNGSIADAMGSDDKVQVMITTNCGQTWTALQTYSAASNLANTLTAQSISLGSYAGQSVQIAFFAQDGPVDDTNDYDFHVDNIRVYNTGATVMSPVAAGAMRLEGRGFAASVYPNPFAQAPVLHLELPDDSRLQIQITDAIGRVVLQQTSVLPAGAADFPLPRAAALSAGIYLLTIDANGQRQQLRLVKE